MEKLDFELNALLGKATQEFDRFVKSSQNKLNTLKVNIGANGNGKGGGLLPDIQKDVQKATQLNTQLKATASLYSQINKMTGMTTEISKFQQVQSTVITQIKERSKEETVFLDLLKQENKLLQQARDLSSKVKTPSGGSKTSDGSNTTPGSSRTPKNGLVGDVEKDIRRVAQLEAKLKSLDTTLAQTGKSTSLASEFDKIIAKQATLLEQIKARIAEQKEYVGLLKQETALTGRKSGSSSGGSNSSNRSSSGTRRGSTNNSDDGWNPLPGLDKSFKKAQALTSQLKLLEKVAVELANTPGMERELAKVQQKQAAIIAQIRSQTTDEQQYVKLLQQENQLLDSAKKLKDDAKKKNDDGWNPLPKLDANFKKTQQLNAEFKMLQQVATQLSQTPGQEKELAKVEQRMAAILAQKRAMTTDENKYISYLKQENQLLASAKARTAKPKKKVVLVLTLVMALAI